MVETKPISRAGIPSALEKAVRYRLLNEPLQAESICRDILNVDADNQEALVTLLLAVTDQFEKEFTTTLESAKTILRSIQGEYEKTYYEGIVNERWANAHLAKGAQTFIGWYRAAMRCYAPDNDDAVLRWNACVRIINRHDFPHEELRHDVHAEYGDDVPLR